MTAPKRKNGFYTNENATEDQENKKTLANKEVADVVEDVAASAATTATAAAGNWKLSTP